MTTMLSRRTVWCASAAVLLSAAAVQALVLDEASAAFNRGEYDTTISLLTKEIDFNPGHEAAYALLASAYEKKQDFERAKDIWTRLSRITATDALKATATRSLLKIRERERAGRIDKEQRREDDPFNVPGIHDLIDYRELDKVDDDKYRPELISGEEMQVPPIVYETKHFTVYACNKKLAKTVGMISEKYLEHLMKRVLDERAWAFRVPILVYKNSDDYKNVGGAPPSLGVTYPDHMGRSSKVMCFQISKPEEMEMKHAGNPVMGNIEDTLPHELTHVVINEFFGAQRIPRWLHEAFARQMEQNREDYKAAADLARDAVAGEYFRFRDLFAAQNYPGGGRIGRFYEQSAAIVTFLLEQGPEATRAFLTELANQRGHDAAAAAAFGIPEQGAVEEFERRWVEWMNMRYAQDLERSDDEKSRDKAADTLTEAAAALLPAVDEVVTAQKIKPNRWRAIELTAPLGTKNKAFVGVGDSLEDWTISGGRLHCRAVKRTGTSIVGIRMNEQVPVAVRCTVRWLPEEDDGADAGWFGFGVLNAKNEDTGAQALFKLADSQPREVLCVVSDDIAVFVNGVCSGRHPAPIPDKSEPDIDYPVALVSDSAVEVTDLEVVSIKPREFVRREAVDPNDPNAPPSSPDSPNDGGSNASGGESGGGGGRGGGGKGAVIP